MAESPYSISAVLSVGYANASVSTWTSATPQNTTAVIVSNDYSYNTLNISLAQTTTITGGQVTFQGSYDGANWFSMQGFTPGTFAPVGPTYNLVANTYAIFQFNLTGVPYFQIVLSSALLGTGSITIGYAADSFVNTMASAQAGTWTVQAVQSGTWNIGTLTTVTNPITVAQPTAANLNATVVGTGVFAVQAAQSGTWTVQQGGAPWSVSQSGTWTVSATQGTSPWVVSLASTTITGTVAVTQSTTPWTVQGDSASGAANAGNPVKIGGAFNTTQPTVTNGQTVDAQMTARGAQIVATGADALNAVVTNSGTFAVQAAQSGTWTVQQGGAPWSINETQINGVALGSPSNFGTSPGAISVQGVNASMFSGTTALTNTGGSLNVNITGGSSSGTQYTTGTVVAAPIGTAALGWDGANVRVIATDTGGQQKILVENFPATQAVTQSTSPWVVSLASTTITGTVAVTQSTSPWVVSGTVTANIGTTGGLALDATLTGGTQKTLVYDGTNTIFTAAHAGYVQFPSAQAVTLASTTVTGTVAVTQSTSPWVVSNSGTFAVQAAQSGTWNVGLNAGSNLVGGVEIYDGAGVNKLGVNASGQITVASIVGALPTGANTIGAVTQASGPWTINVTQFGGSAVVTGVGVSGAGIPRVTVSSDSTHPVTQSGTWTVGLSAGSALVGGVEIYDGGGVNKLGVNASGQITVASIIGALPAGSNVIGGVTQSGTWTVQQGTPPWSVSQSGAWNVNQTIGVSGFGKVTDGTNTAAVKPASTQPATTDPALVVTLSPNSGTITVSTTQGSQATYRVASGTVSANIVTPSFVPHAGVLFQLQGSATNIVNVLHFSLSASGASAGYIDVSMQRTSAAASGGTAVTPIVAPADTTDPAATAVAKYYTAAPTPGTFVANLLSERFFFPQAPYTSTYLDFTFGDIPGTKAVTLRGTSDFFTVQLAGAIPSTPVMDFYCVWTEA